MNGPVSPVPNVDLRLEAEPEAAPIARHRLVAFAIDHGATADLAARVALAVTEAVSNAVRHAYEDDHGSITCQADIEDGLLEIVIADDGSGFRPTGTPGLGAGLAIIADCCDDFTITAGAEAGIEVWMRFAIA